MESKNENDWIDVVALEQLKPGEFQLIDLDGDRVAVFNPDGHPCAIEDRCSHDGGSLCEGHIDGDEITCPRHGARFSIRSGKVLSPPAYEDLHSFPVRVIDSRIQLRDDRRDED